MSASPRTGSQPQNSDYLFVSSPYGTVSRSDYNPRRVPDSGGVLPKPVFLLSLGEHDCGQERSTSSGYATHLDRFRLVPRFEAFDENLIQPE